MHKGLAKLAKPYLYWLYILALLPAILMLVLIFVDCEGIDFTNFHFTLENFRQFKESSTLIAFRNSFILAISTTVFSAILGYVVAYKLVKSKINNKFLILTILILPMWANILLRTDALANVMRPNNIITDLFAKININVSLDVVETKFVLLVKVLIGLVFTYMPFMILPIYTALEKIDFSLEEAALDLGLTDFQKFWKVIFPLSLKGIVTGSIMVLLPSLSGFAIPEIIGNGNVLMIGNVIERMFRNLNYNIGSLLAIILLVIITIGIVIVNKFDKDGETLI